MAVSVEFEEYIISNMEEFSAVYRKAVGLVSGIKEPVGLARGNEFGERLMPLFAYDTPVVEFLREQLRDKEVREHYFELRDIMSKNRGIRSDIKSLISRTDGQVLPSRYGETVALAEFKVLEYGCLQRVIEMADNAFLYLGIRVYHHDTAGCIRVYDFTAKQVNKLLREAGFIHNNKIVVEKPVIERSKVTESLRQKILSRDGYKCRLCSSEANLRVDYIVPISLGGEVVSWNLVTLCCRCGLHRFDKLKVPSLG